jgi:inner membrane protein
VDPITHTLASVALARAGLEKTTRMATPMLVTAGLAADLDWVSRLGGARSFLHGHRTGTHSLVATAAIALATAGVFSWTGRKHPTAPVRFWPALAVSALGAAGHLALDLPNSYGVKLLWPFREKWYAWDLVNPIDPWILILLLLGLLLPGLFRLISEEIGAKPKRRAPKRGAIVALILLVLYIGARWALHDRALEVLHSRVYHGATPLVVGAFPSGTTPLIWYGVVETDNALEEIEVPLGPSGRFDPDLGRTDFKPDPSPALEAARKSQVGQDFLQFARFPKASVERTDDGYRIELRDLRFAWPFPGDGFSAVIELNRQFQVVNEELRYSSRRR